jgi:hypothetical protein
LCTVRTIGRICELLVSFVRSDPFTGTNRCPGISRLSVIWMLIEMFSFVAFILYHSSLLTTARHFHLYALVVAWIWFPALEWSNIQLQNAVEWSLVIEINIQALHEHNMKPSLHGATGCAG